jgi:hypothetical protein
VGDGRVQDGQQAAGRRGQDDVRVMTGPGHSRRFGFVRFRGWSQWVGATLYPEGKVGVLQCVEVFFEASRRQKKQSFGIAGSGASR